MRGERNIDRLPGLGLIEEQAVALETMAFERDRIADAKSAPAHQKRQSAQPRASIIDRDVAPQRVAVDVGGVHDFAELIAGEVVGGDVLGPDLAERQGGILADEVAAERLPEETDDAVLLLRFDHHSFGPGAA